MEYEAFKATIEKMSSEEREVAGLLYMKDVKDLLMSICEAKGIKPKHY